MMNKKDKKVLLITSLLCVLPMVFSVIVYPLLPEQVIIHWNGMGQPDGYAHKAMAAFGLPLFLLVINLVSNMAMLRDPNREVQAPVIKQIGLWAIPVVSVVLVPVSLCIALGADIPIVMITTLLVGALLVAVGNYLPKSRQSYVVGFKLPWTLHDADNWNKTHRLAGRLFVIGGLVMLIGGIFFPSAMSHLAAPVIIVLVLVIIPTIYSYRLYRRAKMEKSQ